MKRLTERIGNEVLIKQKNKQKNESISLCYGCTKMAQCGERRCEFYKALEKLATYEDVEQEGTEEAVWEKKIVREKCEY